MSADDRFLDLASRYLDGETSEAETGELNEILKADEDARRTLARLISQHGNLQWILARPDVPTRRVPRIRQRRTRPSTSTFPMLWLGAAAAFVAIVIGALLSTSGTRPIRPPAPPVVRAPEPAPPAPRKTAVRRAPAARPPADRPPIPGARPRQPKKGSAPSLPPARKTKQIPTTTPPPPTPPTTTPRRTEAAPARVLAVFTHRGNQKPLREGDAIPAAAEGDRLTFPDGTTVELDPGAQIARVSEQEKDAGKYLVLSKGRITADVSRQPAARPFVVATPQARARVVGTRFTLDVKSGSTRLEVTEGKVRLARPNGITSVLVSAGHFAVAAEGTPLEARPIPALVARISFGPSGAPVPEGFQADSGAVFDLQRGYGWDQDISAGTRLRGGSQPLVHRRSIIAGKADGEVRWEYQLKNGTYDVTVVCGGELTSQGPHRVTVEGTLIFKDIFSAKGEHPARKARVQVRDGRLTVKSGAVGTTLRAPDGTHDTIINYIVITRIR